MNFAVKKENLMIDTKSSLESEDLSLSNQKSKNCFDTDKTKTNLNKTSNVKQFPKKKESMLNFDRFPKKNLKNKKKGNWKESEDQLLLQWVETKGPNNWTECSKKIKGRCGKQCRERWVNALDPRIKRGNWEEQEHTLIFEQMKTNWSSWTLISKKLPGRTENAIKNYFYSSVRRLRASNLFKFLKIIIFKNKNIEFTKGNNLIIIYFSI